MTSVIRQTWKRRSSNIYTTSIVFGAVNLIALVLYYFNPDEGSILPFAPDWLMSELLIPIVILIDTVGFYLGTMLDNGSVMKDMLFKDNGYLMKLVPVNSWKLLGGKYIAGLIETVFYGVQCVVYLTMFLLIASDGSTVSGDWFMLTTGQKINCVCLALFVMLVIWLFVNTLLNLARTVTAVITKRWKVPKAVIYIVFFLVAWLTLKCTFEPLGEFIEKLISNDFGWVSQSVEESLNAGLGLGWLVGGVLAVISGIYYAITCVLYDKCVEV